MQDIRMETFIAVCDYMNFTHAAEYLNMTQPAVSRQMKSLEEYYGVNLFRYEGKKMYLTEAGKKLCRSAKTAKADEIRLINEMRNTDNIKLCFGSTPTPGEFMLPQILSKYLKKYPFSEVNMIINNTVSLLSKLDNGEIDFAIVEGNFPKKDYEYMKFSTQKYFPVCSSNFDIEIKTIECLTDLTLILRETGSGNREILEHSLKRHNISVSDFKNKIEINNINVQKALVEKGCGIAFLFEAVVKDEISKGILKEIKVEGFPLFHEINFVWRKKSIFNDDYYKIGEFFNSLNI